MGAISNDRYDDICIAIGYASDNTGKNVKDVFEIADGEMYENKIQLKADAIEKKQ